MRHIILEKEEKMLKDRGKWKNKESKLNRINNFPNLKENLAFSKMRSKEAETKESRLLIERDAQFLLSNMFWIALNFLSIPLKFMSP